MKIGNLLGEGPPNVTALPAQPHMRHIFGPTIIVAPPINNHPRLGLQVQPSTLPLTDTFFWLDLSPIMGRALKRALHLRELKNARNKSRLRPEPTQMLWLLFLLILFDKSVRIADAYRDGHHYGTKGFTDRVYKSHRRTE